VAADNRSGRCPQAPQRAQVPDLPQPSLTDRMFGAAARPGTRSRLRRPSRRHGWTRAPSANSPHWYGTTSPGRTD
jgi:hypothetical protein